MNTDHKWKYITMNPLPPNICGLIKIHKPDAPIRQIINWKIAKKIVQDISKYNTPAIRIQCQEHQTLDTRHYANLI